MNFLGSRLFNVNADMTKLENYIFITSKHHNENFICYIDEEMLSDITFTTNTLTDILM